MQTTKEAQMNAKEVEARAVELFQGGLHCAEAVLEAVMEARGAAGFSPRAATAFGAGVGRSKQGPCGALSGGLIALGMALGRDGAGSSWNAVAPLAAELQAWFAAQHGGPRCAEVLERLGPQEDEAGCIRLSGATAAKVHELLSAATSGNS
jgi:C_GCAxxG_C_C family probable redox protein